MSSPAPFESGGYASLVRELQELSANAPAATQNALAVTFTTQSIIQKATGAGHTMVTLTFDAPFTTEPVFTHGVAMVSINFAGAIPAATAHVLRWVRDAKGRYTGVQVYLDCTLRLSAVYVPARGLKLATTLDGVVPVMAHHLTFAGQAAPFTLKGSTITELHTTQPVSVDL